MPTQYAVVSVAEPERHIAVFGFAMEAALRVRALNEEHSATERRHRIVQITTDDPTEPDWRQREQARLDSGQYMAVPWAGEDWANREHYAHVSQDNPSQISFTSDSAHGAIDRQVRMSPGRYLERYCGLSAISIRNWCARWSIAHEGLVLRFADTAERIEWVYRNGPPSCMSNPTSAYSSPIHPTRVYAAGDLAVAYITDPTDDSRVAARALCWPERHIYGRVYDGAERRLSSLLENEGYRGVYSSRREDADVWHGARLQLVRHGEQDSHVVVPYLDMSRPYATLDLPNNCLRLAGNSSVDGVFHGSSTSGSVYVPALQRIYQENQRRAAADPSLVRYVDTTNLPRFTRAHRTTLERLFVTYISAINPHRQGTLDWDKWSRFTPGVTVGTNLWYLVSRIESSYLRYIIVQRGFIRVGRRVIA